MKKFWWKIRYARCFCQHVGWDCMALAWESAGIWCDEFPWTEWHPADACLEELSNWDADE